MVESLLTIKWWYPWAKLHVFIISLKLPLFCIVFYIRMSVGLFWRNYLWLFFFPMVQVKFILSSKVWNLVLFRELFLSCRALNSTVDRARWMHAAYLGSILGTAYGASSPPRSDTWAQSQGKPWTLPGGAPPKTQHFLLPLKMTSF